MASVRNLYTANRLTCNRGVGVFGSNLAGHGQDFAEPGLLDAGVAACFLDGRENVFGANVADQLVARKGAAAEAGEGAVEAAATRMVRGENLGFGIFRAAVQMHSQFDASHAG